MIALLTPLVWASVPLAVVAVVARRFSGRLDVDAPFCVRRDLGLALVGGLCFALLSLFVMFPHFVHGAPVTGADFHDYCSCIGASRGDHSVGWRTSRSVAAGIVPAVLARPLGVIDGLLAGSFVSQWVTGAGIMLWARALHSRLAGVAAITMACSVAPVVVMSRDVSFYPEVVAVCVMAAALSVLALRFRSMGLLFAAGVAVGLVLLIDVRGLVWAPPFLVVSSLAVIQKRRWPKMTLAACVLLAPLVVSYLAGPSVFLTGVPSLERQMESMVDDTMKALGTPTEWPEERPDLGTVWGRTSLLDFPSSMLRLQAARAVVPDTVRAHPENVQARGFHILPWLPLYLWALGIALWGLRRRPWLIAGLLVPAVPFLMTIYSSGWYLFRPRFLSSGMPIVPVMLGVALAIVIAGALSREDLKTRQPFSMTLPVTVAMMMPLVLGWVPSWFSPSADWRAPIFADNNPVDAIKAALGDPDQGPRATPVCSQVLQADFGRGIQPGSRILNWHLESAD